MAIVEAAPRSCYPARHVQSMGTAGAGVVNQRRGNQGYDMINSKRATSLRVALAAAISGLLATASLAADPPARDCNQVQDYKEMVECHRLDAETNIAKVTAAYELLMKRLGSSPAAEKLSQSQKAWLEYQSSYCDFMASANEGGSIVHLIRAQCYAGIAKSRLHELEYQIDCKQGYFGCFWQR
ncbi:lysozyme inhibitor LprI family protein [Reyranella sp.]|jgi:uncharacterized protein YecT (DUF1311 family)|uniref:lysozyme inhibitor LprI family protein n=1 Tax=Reyranella sp. TaxID=1929291 RepID=UPI00262A89E1|nr:lysozyme inhibitor LprI family protein [Reyranella sp.]HQS18825.1 lysozyme inhibitor LprI family protein [Reyranella sp.]HQT12738.1 lysozyme inhibitor LprI family protein [Reyranella sp.]